MFALRYVSHSEFSSLSPTNPNNKAARPPLSWWQAWILEPLELQGSLSHSHNPRVRATIRLNLEAFAGTSLGSQMLKFWLAELNYEVALRQPRLRFHLPLQFPCYLCPQQPKPSHIASSSRPQPSSRHLCRFSPRKREPLMTIPGLPLSGTRKSGILPL